VARGGLSKASHRLVVFMARVMLVVGMVATGAVRLGGNRVRFRV